MARPEDLVGDALKSIPPKFAGPGGAVAVLKDGAVIGQQVWGYADLEKQIPMTADTLLPICSISKQMLCALVVDLQQNPPSALVGKGDVKEQLTKKLGELLDPGLTDNTGLTLDHLCDNHSGIRDYWALTTLWGANPEDAYSIAKHGPLTLERLRSFHFTPGSQYSYANTNFHIVARVIEAVTGEELGDLLAERIFKPAGMTTAQLCADTSKHPPPIVGYEGIEQQGYRPATNRMEWAGDAGIVASLADMIAYEKFLDRSLTDPDSWYSAVLAHPSQFNDGTPSHYHYGLGRTVIEGVSLVGHSGALRGFRLQRLQVPELRISVVALFNHEADTGAVGETILRKILEKPAAATKAVEPAPGWFGNFIDEDAQLVVKVAPSLKREQLFVTYVGSPELVVLKDASHAESRNVHLSIDGDSLTMKRIQDNRTIKATQIPEAPSAVDCGPFAGDFYCADVDSTFHCRDQGGLLYGSFDGFMGKGAAQVMHHVGQDIWVLPCPRGLDAPAPGDWTLVFHRDETNAVKGVTVGCWLARKLEYSKKA